MKSLQSLRTNAFREAKRLLANYCGGLPIDVEQIAQSRDIKIIRQPLEDEVSGLLIVKEKGVIIGVNDNHHPNRQRFTIAHELGHFVMHRSDSEFFLDATPVFYRRNSSTTASRDQEQAANAFAAALLMPEDTVKQELERNPIDVLDEIAIRQLADRFQVSPQALSIRLYELDLLVYSPGE